MDPLKMYFLSKIGIFHCHFSLPKGGFPEKMWAVKRFPANILKVFLGVPPFEKKPEVPNQLSTTQIACLKSRGLELLVFFGVQRWSSKLIIEECSTPFFLFGPASLLCVSEQFMWGFVNQIQHFDWIFWEAPNFWDTSWLDFFLPPVTVAASKDQLHALSVWLSQGTAWGWVVRWFCSTKIPMDSENRKFP